MSIMNGKRMGGAFFMAPNSVNRDGLLDYCMAGFLTRRDMVGLIVRYTKGTQEGHPKIETGRSSRFSITAARGGLVVHADGETICTDGKSLLVECLPSRLSIVCRAERPSREGSAHVVAPVVRAILSIACRIDRAELGKVPRKGPLIIVTNHVNFLEAPLLYSFLYPRDISAFAKAETWRNPVLGLLATIWECVPVERGANDMGSMRRALEALARGKMLNVMPEGTRSHDGRLRRGLGGVVAMALRSGAPIVPIAHFGGEAFSAQPEDGKTHAGPHPSRRSLPPPPAGGRQGESLAPRGSRGGDAPHRRAPAPRIQRGIRGALGHVPSPPPGGVPKLSAKLHLFDVNHTITRGSTGRRFAQAAAGRAYSSRHLAIIPSIMRPIGSETAEPPSSKASSRRSRASRRASWRR